MKCFVKVTLNLNEPIHRIIYEYLIAAGGSKGGMIRKLAYDSILLQMYSSYSKRTEDAPKPTTMTEVMKSIQAESEKTNTTIIRDIMGDFYD